MAVDAGGADEELSGFTVDESLSPADGIEDVR